MKWNRGGIVALGALLALGATEVSAQRVESIMRARERLELTDQQVANLDAIRRDVVAQRAAEAAEMAEMRSQLEAGQIRRSDLMAAMEDRQDAREGRAEELRSRIESVLTEDQLSTVEEMRRRNARRGTARRGGAPQAGPRPMGPRGRVAPGPRGPGAGPAFEQGPGPRGRPDFGPR